MYLLIEEANQVLSVHKSCTCLSYVQSMDVKQKYIFEFVKLKLID